MFLHLKLSFRRGSNYHSFHPAVVLVSTSADILLPFVTCPDPTPAGVGGFGHLRRACCTSLVPWVGHRAGQGRYLHFLSCYNKLYNILHPKQSRGLWVCKAVARQGLQHRCILWNESSHYAALLACVCLSRMALISSCPVTPWLIHQCQSWWMCLWGRALVPGSCWVFKIQVGQKFNPSFNDLSGANSAAMVSGNFRKQHDFSPGFFSQAQHGPIQINQVE